MKEEEEENEDLTTVYGRSSRTNFLRASCTSVAIFAAAAEGSAQPVALHFG